MPERRGTVLFDGACLDLARHFYPEYPEHVLATLAHQLQTVCEDFVLAFPQPKRALNADDLGDGCPNDEPL